MNGAILEDGTIVRFPPHIGMQMQSLLRAGSQLSVAGYGTQNAYGRAIESTSLSIDGQPAIALFGPPRP
jgi:hypothetical protein